MSVPLSFKRGDIIVYLRRRCRLAADTTRDAIDSTLEVDIMKKIPSDISEMYSTCFNRLYGADRSSPAGQKWRGGGQPFRFLINLPVEAVVSVLLERKGNCYLYGVTERNRCIQTGS